MPSESHSLTGWSDRR